MSSSELINLSRRERQVMDLIFEHKQLTAQEVMEKMADPPGYATVRSILRILEEKGHLQHSKSGRQFVYTAIASTEKVRQKSLNHVLKTFFGGSLKEAVSTFLEQSDTDLSEEELDELTNIIEAAKKKGLD